MKKRLLVVLIVLVIFIGSLFAIRDYYSNTFTVTSTSAYVASEAIEGAGYVHKYILIENTGSSYAVLYKAWGYPSLTSSYYEEFVAETSIAAAGEDTIKLANTAYAKVVLQFKWVTGATTSVVTYNMTP